MRLASLPLIFLLSLIVGSCSSETPVDPYAVPRPGSGWDRRFTSVNAPNDVVEHITVGGNYVYAGGAFTSVRNRGDQVERKHFVTWTGTEWKTMASSVGAADPLRSISVNALQMFEGNLFACGLFESIDGVRVFEFAQWNGATWSDVAGIRPHDIAVSGPNMYVSSNHGIAQIKNGTWDPFEKGLEPPLIVSRIDAIETTIYGMLGTDVHQWRGNAWTKIGTIARSGSGTPVLNDLIVIDDMLYAVGDFDVIESTTLKSYGIARWDGSRWNSVGDDVGARAAVYTLAKGASGGLLAGKFGSVAQLSSTSPIDPLQWTTLGTVERDDGLRGRVRAIATHAGIVYIGGDFTTIVADGEHIASNYFGAYH